MMIRNSLLPLIVVLWCGCSPDAGTGVSARHSGASLLADTPQEKSPAQDVVPAAPDRRAKSANQAAWPNWLGPDHNGISAESGWSSDWPKDGLPIVWSREIGTGFSSVSIESDRLYTMGHVDGKEYVYCLNLATGKTVWTHSYPCKLVDNLHDGGPGATPTIDGQYIYTVGREGQLFCLRQSDGSVVWSKHLQEDLDVTMPEWGFTCSPYILDQRLILVCGRVVSYDKVSGKKHWQTKKHLAGYGSAISFQQKATTLLATLDCDGLRVVRSADGTETAFYAWDSPFRTNSTTPIVQDDKIFISTGYQIGCGLFRLDDTSLELVYRNRKMRNHFNNSILLDGYLYGFDGNSNLGRVVQLTCMNFQSGEVAWKHRGLGCGSLMIVDGRLLILGEDGTLVLAKATPDGFEEIARSPFLEGRCWTIPVFLNGRVYGRNAAGKLVCAQVPK